MAVLKKGQLSISVSREAAELLQLNHFRQVREAGASGSHHKADKLRRSHAELASYNTKRNNTEFSTPDN